MAVSGSVIYPKDSFPAVASTTVSPHLVGFWPLNNQLGVGARDISGRRHHFLKEIQAVVNNTGASGWLVNVASVGMRCSAEPTDVRFDIGAPGASFIAAVEVKTGTPGGADDQTILGKGYGGDGAVTGALGLYFGMIDHSAGVPRARVVIGFTSSYTADLPAGTTNHIAFVRDASGAMGTANRIYVYINGVRDTTFASGAGFIAFAPTAQNNVANLALCDYGKNVTGGDLNPSGANTTYEFRNLQLAILKYNSALSYQGTSTIAAVDQLIAKMATTPTYMLTAGDLP